MKSNGEVEIKKSDLEIDDTVRIRVSTRYSKASDNQFSDKIYHVTEINGNQIRLDNNKLYPRYDLLKVDPDSEPILNNPITKAKKVHKQTKLLRKEDMKDSNVVRGRRQRRVRQVLDL